MLARRYEEASACYIKRPMPTQRTPGSGERVQPLPLEPNCKVARHLYTCSTSGTCSSCESSSVTTGSDVVEPRGAVVKRPIFESESRMLERALTGVAPRALASSTSDTCETGGARSVASGGGRCGKGAAGGAHLMVQAGEAGNGEGVVEPGVDELLRRRGKGAWSGRDIKDRPLIGSVPAAWSQKTWRTHSRRGRGRSRAP